VSATMGNGRRKYLLHCKSLLVAGETPVNKSPFKDTVSAFVEAIFLKADFLNFCLVPVDVTRD
jgi:hypothetical protein